MRRFLIALAAACLLALRLTPGQAAQLQQQQFELQGHERRFSIYVPDNLARWQGPRPLLLVLHGIVSTDRLVGEKAHWHFNDLAEQFGFVVVYPVGLGRTWNLGEGLAAELARPRRDDLAYLDAVLARVRRQVPVDPARIFAAGFSLGGAMALSLACKRPGLLRGVASVSMTLPEFLRDDCTAAPPFAVMMIQGTADPWVPFYGGFLPTGPKTRERYLSHDQSLAFFLQRNRCNPAKVERTRLDWVKDGTSVVVRRWRTCVGPPVMSFAIIGGGHTWPREAQAKVSRPFLGRVSQEIDPAQEIWDFFNALP